MVFLFSAKPRIILHVLLYAAMGLIHLPNLLVKVLIDN
jgi:hypothetical protein